MPELLRGHGVSPGRRPGRWCGCRTRSPSRRPAPPPADTDADVARIRPAHGPGRHRPGARAGKAEGDDAGGARGDGHDGRRPGLADLAENAVREQGIPRSARRVGRRQHVPRPARRRRRVRRRRERATSRTCGTGIVGELLGLPAPGIPDPGHPFILVARDLAPADTADHQPRAGAGLRHRGGRADQPHRDPGPDARHPGRGVVPGGAGDRGGHRPRARRGHRHDRRRARRGHRHRGPRTRGPRCGPQRALGGPGGHRRRAPGRAARQHRRRRGCPGRGRRGSRGRRPVPHRVPLPRPRRRAVGEEQAESYAAVFGAFGAGTKIVVRTLDAGADKPLPFLDQADEANPALGVRGLRIGPRAARGPGHAAARDRGGRRGARRPTCG